MSTMTATRVPANTERNGTLSNEALRALSTSDLRLTYRYAVRAAQVAEQIGQATAVAAINAYLGRIVAEGKTREGHDDVCVCGPYDRCKAQRALSGNWRDMHRAYND